VISNQIYYLWIPGVLVILMKVKKTVSQCSETAEEILWYSIVSIVNKFFVEKNGYATQTCTDSQVSRCQFLFFIY